MHRVQLIAQLVSNISAALNDTDGSETLGIEIVGVPDGTSLSAGTAVSTGDGLNTWILEPEDLDGLTLTTTDPDPTDLDLTIRAISTETEK